MRHTMNGCSHFWIKQIPKYFTSWVHDRFLCCIILNEFLKTWILIFSVNDCDTKYLMIVMMSLQDTQPEYCLLGVEMRLSAWWWTSSSSSLELAAGCLVSGVWAPIFCTNSVNRAQSWLGLNYKALLYLRNYNQISICILFIYKIFHKESHR